MNAITALDPTEIEPRTYGHVWGCLTCGEPMETTGRISINERNARPGRTARWVTHCRGCPPLHPVTRTIPIRKVWTRVGLLGMTAELMQHDWIVYTDWSALLATAAIDCLGSHPLRPEYDPRLWATIAPWERIDSPDRASRRVGNEREPRRAAG